MNNSKSAHRRHGLLSGDLTVWYVLTSYELLSEMPQRHPKLAGHCHCSWLPAITRWWDLLLKTPHTLVAEHRETSGLTRKLSLVVNIHRLASPVLAAGWQKMTKKKKSTHLWILCVTILTCQTIGTHNSGKTVCGGNQPLSWIDLRPASQEEIHALYFKHSQIHD